MSDSDRGTLMKVGASLLTGVSRLMDFVGVVRSRRRGRSPAKVLNDAWVSSCEGVEELTAAECLTLFSAATATLGLTPEDFERKWRAGDFANNPDPRITRVAMLMPHPWEHPPTASSVPADLKDYDRIAGPDYISVVVPEHTSRTAFRAASTIAEEDFGGGPGEYPTTLAWLAGRAHRCWLRQHLTAVSDQHLGECQELGWWCEHGDGPERAFWAFDRADLTRFEDLAWAETQHKPRST